MNREAVQPLGHISSTVLVELERDKLAMQLEAAALGAMLQSQGQLGGLFITTPGDGKELKLTQSVAGVSGKIITVESVFTIV